MAKQLSQEMLETLLEERDAGYSLKGLNQKFLLVMIIQSENLQIFSNKNC